MHKEIVLGKKYEVKPAQFHRNIVGVAKSVCNGGIVFQIDFCDICDRDTAKASDGQVTADYADIKGMMGETCFFS